MLTRLLTDKLAEYSYNAALAGLYYSLTPQTLQSSLTIAVQGYNHKLPLLTQTILEALVSFSLEGEEEQARFERLKDRLVKDYKNDLLAQPYQVSLPPTHPPTHPQSPEHLIRKPENPPTHPPTSPNSSPWPPPPTSSSPPTPPTTNSKQPRTSNHPPFPPSSPHSSPAVRSRLLFMATPQKPR